MFFYFVCNTILGIVGGSAYLTKEYLDNPISESEELLVDEKRNWMRDSVYAKTIILIAELSFVVSIITSIIQYGFYWGFITFLELLFGFVIARLFIPAFGLYILLITSPIPLTIIFGAYWGFWYIG